MAFPFPGCDPAFVSAILSRMAMNERDGFFESDSDDADRFEELGEPSSAREEMIERFKTMRAKFVRPGGIFADQMFTGPMYAHAMTMDDSRPQSQVRSLRDLKPMIGKELELGVMHRGRYLCGWVAVDDAFFGIASTSILLEDVTGYLVEIAAYGLVDTELPPHERQRILTRKFPKGRAIIVLEPYYKVRMDGSLGVRVEKANEITPWQDEPTELTTWKNFGNEFFGGLNSNNEGRGALACYQRALQADQSEIHSLVSLLNNIATCRFKTKDYASSIQFSGAAVHLDPTYFEGWYRLASALAEHAAESQEGGNGRNKAIVPRVVAHARSELPSMSSDEKKLLENIVKKASSVNHSSLESYAEWSVELSPPGLIVVQEELSELKSVDVWRREGTESFTKGDYQAAEECYRKGVATLVSCCQKVSVVLNNIAAVHLMLSRQKNFNATGCELVKVEGMPLIEACLLNCTVACVIDPLNYKAWLRRERCLQDIGFKNEKCVRDLQEVRASVMAIESVQTNERLKEFKHSLDAAIQQHLQKQPASKDPQEAPGGDGSAFDVHGVEDIESIDEYIARMEGFVSRTRFAYALTGSHLNPRMHLFPRELKMFLTDLPPEIHIEFPELRAWPEGVASDFAYKALYRAYLEASTRPWVDALSMREGSFFTTLTLADVMKRWHGTGALEIMRARGSSRLGDIVDGREARSDYEPQYEARTRSSFANNPSRAEVYYFASTHVAIGFCDFSSLLAATLRNNSNTDAPLRFVGFDMNEFAVAKCKVVAQMLGSSSVAISSVMEIWLSSTWSDTTLADFKECVNAVLMNEHQENSKVMAYLRHWASAEPVSAATAHCTFWENLAKRNKIALGSLCSFRREIDRLDLTEYMLSGEIRASADILKLMATEQPGAVDVRTKAKKKRNRKYKKKTAAKSEVATPTTLVGNLTMFNVPAGSPPLEDDIAFNTVDFGLLVEDYVTREKKQKRSTNGLSVVDLFIIHILKNLFRLRELLRTNKLTIEVNYGVLKAVRGEAVNDYVNQELLARIARLRPDTISWSNMVDDFLPEDFHDLARRCSAHGNCVHYGYSMNWPTQVCGTSIIDLGKGHFKKMLDVVLDSALGFPIDLAPMPLPSVVDMLKAAGLDKLLFLPFREHSLNSTAYVLAQLFNDEWADHFMKKGMPTTREKQRLGALNTPLNCGLQMGAMELALPCPLYRSSLTLHMSWCYDPRVRLVVNSRFEATPAYVAMLAQVMASFRV
ncbi:hypothetical protein V7S43_008714 [Phytophthora oleae]|uniref:Clu domain-containing protein n=1 Tax=Phytophthora oleae TaxID=2107226 RepID=A0ABD3FJJ6_9STRA